MKHYIQIRKAAETDLDCIERLYDDICDYLEAHKNYPGWRKGIYPARCDAEKGLMENALYIARIGEKAAGTIMLKHVPEEGYKNGNWLTEDDYKHIYVVYTLAVHPDFLKCGIGTELLAFAEQVAGLLYGFGGAGLTPGLMMVCRYFYWSRPGNDTRAQIRLERERIEMHDELKVKLRDRSGRLAYVVGMAVTSASIVAFSVLGALEIVDNSRLIVLYLGGYLAFQYVAGILIYRGLLKKY